ncbi:MAG TPA: FAD binding domain-containing protein, partial [Haliangium sp.]|nr:FAD binding domain-containing protein [Haliangium sp.]
MLEPRSLDEAFRMMQERAPVIPLAGGTDVYVDFNAGRLPGQRYLNLARLDALRGIALDGDALRIGALVTYTQMIASALVTERVPILASAAREVGGIQIQNRGTLGGNIANGSPAGDTLPVLAVADATVVLGSVGGTRRVPFTSFYTGYRASVRSPEELIVAVEIPPIQGKQWFRKVGTRAAQAISKIVMAGVRTATPRVAIGSVAPTVVRLPRTEAHLAAGGSLDEAGRILAEEIRPIDDL